MPLNKFFILGVLLSVASSSYAQEKTQNLWLAGTQQSKNDGYSFAGVILPLSGSQLGKGAYQRHFVSHLHYAYNSGERGSDERVKAQAPGIESALGYIWSNEHYFLDLSAGLGLRHSRFRPFTPNDEHDGWRIDLTPQLQAGYNLTPQWQASMIASTGLRQKSIFLRARLSHQYGDWKTGLQAAHLEGKNYRTRQYSVFAAYRFSTGLELELGIGRNKPKADPSGHLLSLNLNQTF